MNKIVVSIALALSIFAVPGITHATVGGPTYIHSFTYNPADESVYFVSASNSGRGCPPELMKMSLETGAYQTVYSCDQGEKLLSSGAYDPSRVMAAIKAITANFKALAPVSLKKNNISIDIRLVKTEKLNPELDQIKDSIFAATAYQSGQKVADLQLTGCNAEQPFTFAGYAVPGFEKKIVLLLSTKGDCFEGGYTSESLHVLGGLDSVNRTYLNYYKGDEALTPNEGTLTVYAGEQSPSKPVNADPEPQQPATAALPTNKTNPLLVGAVAITALLLGLLLGRVTKRGA